MTFEAHRFGERVEQRKEELGLTNDQFLHMTGMSSYVLTAWKNGNRSPNATSVATVARVLDVSCDWLMGITDTKRRYGQ